MEVEQSVEGEVNATVNQKMQLPASLENFNFCSQIVIETIYLLSKM